MDKLKQNAPDLTPVTNACQSSYRATRTVASNVYKAVTVDGAEKVKDYLPDSQTQEKIKRIVKEVAVPELVRSTPIRALVQSYRILVEDPPTSSVHDNKKFEHPAEELKKVQMKNEELREEVEKIKHDNKKFENQAKELKKMQMENEELREEVEKIKQDNRKFEHQAEELEKMQMKNEKLREEVEKIKHDNRKFEHQAEELEKMQIKNEELREEVEKIKHDNKILRGQIVEERTKRSGSHNDSFNLELKEKQKSRL